MLDYRVTHCFIRQKYQATIAKNKNTNINSLFNISVFMMNRKIIIWYMLN